MQHHSGATALAPSLGRWALAIDEAIASLSPPRVPRTARGLSGRPTCRIYARGDVWVLALDPISGGWLHDGVSRRLTFPTLAAAIGYAECKGLDYRIERPRQHQSGRRSKRASARLPRSWLAHLARNGRKGDIYHG